MKTVSLRIQTSVRAWARRLGLISTLTRIRNVVRPPILDQYENAFSSALLSAVQAGDCVWDVGANIGFYTRLLKERVGPEGLVCAFEPAPRCYQALLAERSPSLLVFNLALGDKEAELPLTLAEDPLGSTHSLVNRPTGANEVARVHVLRGDDVLQQHNLRVPNVVKVDVEGFEEEVIMGLASTLPQPECRAFFCEVHFGILDQRGERHAPSRIEKTLKGYGFSTRWIDSSHLAAMKRGSE